MVSLLVCKIMAWAYGQCCEELYKPLQLIFLTMSPPKLYPIKIMDRVSR